jgi:hypothetical protein
MRTRYVVSADRHQLLPDAVQWASLDAANRAYRQAYGTLVRLATLLVGALRCGSAATDRRGTALADRLVAVMQGARENERERESETEREREERERERLRETATSRSQPLHSLSLSVLALPVPVAAPRFADWHIAVPPIDSARGERCKGGEGESARARERERESERARGERGAHSAFFFSLHHSSSA